MSYNEVVEMFGQDERIGVQKLIIARKNQIEKENNAIKKYNDALHYENKYAGKIICGIDEVGRGPLAGPVVACAAILNANHHFIGLTDSKQMSKQKRASMELLLVEHLKDYAFGSASVEEIDELNIFVATQLAMKRAVANLAVTPDVLLIDAMQLNTGIIEESIIKGDTLSISISAASVLAKEHRDKLMAAYSVKYPHYGFEQNAGYGTKAHLDGISKFGITPIHRKSFEPIKSIVRNLET